MPSLSANHAPKEEQNERLRQAWKVRNQAPEKSKALISSILQDHSKDKLIIAKAKTVLSYHLMREGRYDLLLETAEAILGTLEEQENIWLARLYLGMGIAHHSITELSKALGFFLKALELSKRVGCNEGIFTSYHSLARHYFLQSELEQAMPYFEKCYDFVEDDNDRKAFLLFNHALCLASLGELKKAEAKAYEAYDIISTFEHSRSKMEALLVLAKIAKIQKNFMKAVEKNYAAIQIAIKGKLPYGTILLDIASIELEHKRLKKTAELLTRAEPLLQGRSDRHDLAKFHQLSFQLYELTGDYQQSLKHHKAFFELNQDIYNEESDIKSKSIEISHRIEQLKQESELLQQKNLELERTVKKLELAQAQLFELSHKDSLTGLFNRRYLFAQVNTLMKTAFRYEHPLSLIMLDIDYFKLVNDRFGHQIGDNVLEEVAKIIQSSLRDADIASRYGGEEFAIVMPETSIEGALLVCERIRKRIEQNDWSYIHESLAVTVSLGAAKLESSDTQELLLARSDKHLYAAKQQGRNRVNSDADGQEVSLTFWR